MPPHIVWAGVKTFQRPLLSVLGLRVSGSSFTLCRYCFLFPFQALPYTLYLVEASLWQPGFQEAGISQMKLSDTGYLSLWFWMKSVWGTAAAPTALFQLSYLPVTECPTFLFLTSCHTPDYYLSGSSWSLLWMTFPPLITICWEWCQYGLCNRCKPCSLGNFGLWVNVTVVKYWYKTTKWLAS